MGKVKYIFLSAIVLACAFTIWSLALADTDTTAPSAIANLAGSAATQNSITLTWTAPGDDSAVGTSTSYKRHIQQHLGFRHAGIRRADTKSGRRQRNNDYFRF